MPQQGREALGRVGDRVRQAWIDRMVSFADQERVGGAMPTVRYDDLYKLAVAIYEAAGTDQQSAETVARHQAGANLVGHDSHGIQLLPTYIIRIDRGHIQPKKGPEIIKETPTTIFVNGQWGFGPVVSEYTMERCIAKAQQVGVAVGVVREQSHVGRLADYPLMATKQGFISMMM